MDRRGFLGKTGAALLGLTALKHLPPAVASPVPLPAVTSATAASNISLVASGGLCAPLSPIYTMPAFPVDRQRPMFGMLPKFTASQGGISISGS